MTKSELIDKVAKEAKIPRAAAERAINSFTDTICEALKTGSARKGRNPRTGAEIDIPAVKVPKFKCGKSFKDSVQ
jgi:DNA-binding protein HU-beta